MTSLQEAQARLYRQLVGAGALAPEWEQAYWQAERHRFIPERAWTQDETRPLDRTASPDDWANAAYSNKPVIIQLNDGQDEGPSFYTSSVSQPSLVFAMLNHLDVRDGMRVLEIGTGGGWNAGLLAARLGSDAVTTVEIDGRLGGQASGALASAGLHPTVVITDGVNGYPPNAPYDRIISTAAARRVPAAWLEQTRPGGLILLPFGTAFCNGALLRLDIQGDGTAVGRFVADDYGFMWLRSQRDRYGTLEERIRPDHDQARGTTEIHPSNYLLPEAAMQIGLAVPDVHELTVFWDEEEDKTDPAGGKITDDNRFTTYLLHQESGSWASVAVTFSGQEAGEHTTRQHGPRRLVDEVEEAWRAWHGAGQPGVEAYRVVVTPEGQRAELVPADV